ncbi:MAG: hypothetical protein JST90_03780 [Bacteroidetes bacterium]|nr:hypothetical protein [Bacteroidota bacterium]
MKSSSLFDLIHSLSKHEKGYFRKFTRIYSSEGEKNYIELFDYIDRMEVYDERVIRSRFKNTTWISHLPVLKKYLFAQILKSLELYQRAGKKDEQTIFRQVDILIARGMFREAASLLNEGVRIAQETENYHALLSACDRERTLVIHLYPALRHGEKFSEVYDKQSKLIAAIQSIMHIKRVSDWLLNTYHHRRIVRDEETMAEIEAYVSGNLLPVIYSNPSLAYRHIALSAAMIYCSIKGDEVQLHHYAGQHLDLVLQHELYFRPRYMQAMSVYFNYLSACIGIKAFDEFEERIVLLEGAMTSNGIAGKAHKFKLLYDLYFTCIKARQAYDMFPHYLKKFEKEFKYYSAHLPAHDLFVLASKVAHLLFTNRRIEEAADWTAYCISLDCDDINEYARVQLRLLDIILHYELGHYRLIESKLLSIRRYLNGKKILYRTEKTMISYLKLLIKASSDTRKAVIFGKFHEEISRIYAEHPTERVLIDELYLIPWSAAKAKAPGALVASL